jgi:pilus assembly protein Flp/PilA
MLIPFLRAKLREFVRNESGATAIEYGLIAGLLSIVIIAGLGVAGPRLAAVFTAIGAALPAVPAP